VIISRKRYKIETWWQWKSKSYVAVAYPMAPLPMLLNDPISHLLFEPF